MALTKSQKRLKIKRRVRKNIFGTTQKPRLSVFRSNKEIYAQIIDDITGKTLVHASSRDKSLVDVKVTKIELAIQVGKLIGEKAINFGLKSIVFDRNGFLYHGRVKALAEGARQSGLNF